MKLGIAFVSWGRADLLDRTLKSFDLHTPIEPPACIVDNGSQEKTTQVIDLHRDCFDHIMYWQTNKGKPAAHNYSTKVLVEDHKCTHILFCDSDIEFLPGWYEKLLGVWARCEAYGRVGAISAYAHGTQPKMNPLDSLGVSENHCPPGCSFMMSVETLAKIGGFDECRKICKVDVEMNKILRNLGYNLFSVWPTSLIEHTGIGHRTFNARSGESIYHE